MKSLLTSCLLCSMLMVQAQESKSQEKQVMDVVFRLFEGMRLADTTILRSVFIEGAQLQTAAFDAEGNSKLRSQELSSFIASIAKAQPGMLNEPLWDYHVNIDNNFASVWAKYAFYYGNSFSHCGVDAFYLLQTKEGWKIFNLVDTRQKEGCDVPANIKSLYENR
jgi:hypothetical protein